MKGLLFWPGHYLHKLFSMSKLPSTPPQNRIRASPLRMPSWKATSVAAVPRRTRFHPDRRATCAAHRLLGGNRLQSTG